MSNKMKTNSAAQVSVIALLITCIGCYYLYSKVLSSEVLYYGGKMSCTEEVEQNKHLPIIYVITPTYKRLTQIPELTRLGNTLRNVPAVHWIVVEEGEGTLEEVRYLLNKIDIKFTYLSATRYKNAPKTLKGIHQRNKAIFWLRTNIDMSKDGVVYFADDDNTYDLELFTEMRHTKKISVWPVGFVSKKKYQTPILENGKVVKFDAWNTKNRKFPIDMAGFALNTKTFYFNDDLYFRTTFQKGYQESSFLEICCTLDDLEPKANECTKVLVWHTKTKDPLVYRASYNATKSDTDSKGTLRE
ncbi:galactosylgalactosylxylosylprotein 3-beta-glucuronosyltransferase 2-like [Mytilus californianus]|uniref:galactosylgalactosylxylosylprotein 3-beta-glucuronosyltransferase 2-like n=1 Tax=Mytilus californianus TaxID=6549 RepID=UPI002245B430|nr:galactosylgalactosylxylosylprotein 3-beta-glucuronosyltransferase 2-like [Mytilus californianus]